MLHFADRQCAGLLLLGILWAFPVSARAASADCPTLKGEIIRWIVPTTPGGGYDAYSRLLQPFLERQLEAQIVIENRAEAGGIVGALVIRDAEPDGRTLGIINASGLLAANAIQGDVAPDPVTEFTILGQVSGNDMVVFTGRDSRLGSIGDLLQASQTRAIVVGVRDSGSTSFFAVPVTAALLGIDYELVSGYTGSAARALAVMRGEVDIIMGNFDSMRGQVQAGELVPLLDLSRSADTELSIPQLGGPDGLARQRATASGRAPQEAQQAADDLADIVGAGRLVAGPPGLAESLSICLGRALGDVVQSPGLLAAAQRAQLGITYANGASAHQQVLVGARAVKQFSGLIQAAIEQTRE